MANPVAAVQAVATVGSAVAGSRASKKATQAQTQAEDRRIALEREMFERQMATQQPFLDIGLQNLNRLAQLYGPGGEFTRPFSAEDMMRDPGYQFRLAEGEKALARMQAARGGGIGLASGRAIREGVRYAGDLASQEYGAAQAREANRQTAIANALLGLGNLGPTSAAQMGGAARGYATGAGGAMSTSGQARASGYLTQGNILRDVLSKGTEWYGKTYPTKG